MIRMRQLLGASRAGTPGRLQLKRSHSHAQDLSAPDRAITLPFTQIILHFARERLNTPV